MSISLLCGVVFATAVQAGTIGDAMPFSLMAGGRSPEHIAERLRYFKERCGMTNFVLSGPTHTVRISGYMSVEGYRGLGKKLAAVKALLKDDGINAGFLAMPTLNLGCDHPFRVWVLQDGKPRAIRACPADGAFVKHFSEKFAAVAAESKPFLFMFEDDYGVGPGCFCDHHVAAFSKLTGVKRTRAELLEALKKPANAQLVRRWLKMQTDDLVALSRVAGDAIRAVSPKTRIGLSAPGGSTPEGDIMRVAAALSGPMRPYVRWGGSVYGYDTPTFLGSLTFREQWTRENIPVDRCECVLEVDPCPHNAFYASGARIAALCNLASAYGLDGMYYWGASSACDADRSPEYLNEFRDGRERWEEVRRVVRGGRSVGVSLGFDPDLRGLKLFGHGDAWGPICPEWDSFFFSVTGIPMTTRKDAGITAYFGTHAFLLKSDEEIRAILKGNVLLDGGAAVALTARGFAGDIGVEAVKRDKIDFTGDVILATGERLGCAYHQNFGLDGAPVARLKLRGAKADSMYFSASVTNHVQPSVARFVNAAGGRVMTLAACVCGCHSSNLYGFRKRELLLEGLRWLGGEESLPAVVTGEANVMVQVNEDAARTRLFIQATNVSCDMRERVTLSVSPRWRGGRVEILEGGAWRRAPARWEGEKLVVTALLPVYRALALRILPLRVKATVSAPLVAAAAPLPAPFDIGVHFSEKNAWVATAEDFAVDRAENGFTFASDDRDIVNCLRHDTCLWHGMNTGR